MTVLIKTIILSNDIDIANVDTVIHWLDIYLLSDLVQQSRCVSYQKKKVYLMLLLNSESQNVILFDKSDNSKMLKFYVNNLQCMLKILFKHLNDDMKSLNCNLLWFCIFCKSETFRLVNSQITHISEIIFRQSFFFISFSSVRLSQTLTLINHIHLQMWREWYDQLWLKQQCIWYYLQTES